MTVEVANRFWGTLDLRGRRVALSVTFLAGALALYAVLRAILLTTASRTPIGCLGLDIATFAAACAFVGIRHDELPSLLRPLLRGIAAVVLVQVAFDGAALTYAPAYMISGEPGAFFIGGSAIGVASGLLAIWRPSFALPLLFHYVAFRHQLNRISGIPVSETDYLSMLDIGEFVVLGSLATVFATRPRNAAQLLPAWASAAEVRGSACALIWAWAVGAHLGNYFISGWTKVQAGGGDPLFWLLHNPTQTSILIGLNRGDNPLAAWPWLVQLSWDAIVKGGVALNFFVLALQLAAPLAILRRRLLMAFTLLYDLFHVAVYMTLGAMFSFWIAVNVLIYLSAKRMNDEALTPAMQAVTLLSILTAHYFFYTSHLGWLDGAKLESPSVVAETRDGRRMPVPSVFFGMLSYSIAQTAMFVPDDSFPMRLGGNTYNPADWKDAQSCGPKMVHHQSTGVTLDTVEAMVRQTDAAMRRHPFVKDANLYYIYPHHMVANPLMFEPFNALTMNDIVRYHYVVDSVCLSLRDGHLVRDVRKTTDIPINVSP
ncbi:MAG: hypothetical protein WCF13_10330 [Stellaceae bacterium]